MIKWEFPIMRKVEGLEVEFKGQKKEGYTEKDMLLMLPRDGYTDKEWRDAANDNHGTTKATYYKFQKSLREQDKVFKNSDGRWVKM